MIVCQQNARRHPDRSLSGRNFWKIRKVPEIRPGKSLTRWARDKDGWEPSGLDQPTAHRVADEAGGLVDVGLFHDPRPMGLRGLEGDSQQLGDLLRRLDRRNQVQALALPC